MFVWAPIPEPYREMGSLEFAKYLVTEADVATSPGVGFGNGGEGFVRFALVENEQRIQQARPQPAAGAHQTRLTGAPRGLTGARPDGHRRRRWREQAHF